MKFTAPPLPLPRFLQETFTDAEWLRRLKPDGTPYDLGAHLGYDSQFSNNDRRLMAVWRGRCWSRRWQGFTGWVIGVEAPDGLSYVHCHAVNRSAKDGMMVNAGEVIGTMGNHSHQLVVKNRTWSRATIVDPGPALRKLQEELRPLTDAQMQELKAWTKEVAREMASRAARELLSGNHDAILDPKGALKEHLSHSLASIDAQIP